MNVPIGESEKTDPDSNESLGAGRTILSAEEFPLNQWRDDDGSANGELRALIARGDRPAYLELLARSRVLVAIMSRADSHTVASDTDHDDGDKESHMQAVSLRSADGRLGLVCFTGIDSLTSWNASARPVPIRASDAAVAALDEGAQAIILDPAGPIPITITLPDVVALTQLDQRHRAEPIITDLLQRVLNPQQVSIDYLDGGILQITIPIENLDEVQKLIATNLEIHSFVPGGIALATWPQL